MLFKVRRKNTDCHFDVYAIVPSQQGYLFILYDNVEQRWIAGTPDNYIPAKLDD